MIKVKNNKQASDTWCGMGIEPASYYQLEFFELNKWQNDSKVISDISSGDLIINDGDSDIIDVSDAINVLKEKDPKEVDLDGRQVIRAAAGKPGWTYLAHPIEFQTAKIGSVYDKDKDGADKGISSIKFYNADNVEVTAVENELSITKTVLLFKPGYDYELVAGSIKQINTPSSDLRVWVVGGIIEYGGPYVKEFCGGVNMAFFSPEESLKTDGRAAKYMKKDTVGVPYQKNQLQITIKHAAGYQHRMLLMFEYYRA
jgi:hypothetical protein